MVKIYKIVAELEKLPPEMFFVKQSPKAETGFTLQFSQHCGSVPSLPQFNGKSVCVESVGVPAKGDQLLSPLSHWILFLAFPRSSLWYTWSWLHLLPVWTFTIFPPLQLSSSDAIMIPIEGKELNRTLLKHWPAEQFAPFILSRNI